MTRNALIVFGLLSWFAVACEAEPDQSSYEPRRGKGESCTTDTQCSIGVCAEGVCASTCGWRDDNDAITLEAGDCVGEGFWCSGTCCQLTDVRYESCSLHELIDCPNENAWFIEGYCKPDPAASSGGSGSGSTCTYDSSCGSREICRGGECVRVDCTSDSQCGSCERCSVNSCVDCGEGPYGCYC